jgi:hypothetical protein
MAINIPNIPNGSIGPDDCTHSATKNVQAKDMMPLKNTIITKQSPDTALYESMTLI